MTSWPSFLALLALFALVHTPIVRGADRPGEMDAETARILEQGNASGAGVGTNPASVTAPVSAEPVNLSIDWDHPLFKTAREAYSLNAFRNFGNEVPANPEYQKNISYINPGMLRYHNSGMVGDSQKAAGWIKSETHAWDVDKIKAVTANWPKGPAVQITIPRWPDWMSSSPEKLLDEQNYEAYATLCADLVRIINLELKLGVKKWEPMNERELVYIRALEKAGKKEQYSKLITIFNLCAKKMKAVDPTIQVGGPAVASAGWTEVVTRFAEGTRGNLDFFSCHLYAGNDAAASDEHIFNTAVSFGPTLAAVSKILKKKTGREIEISLNEFNINYTFKTADKRMTNHKGAVFDALVMISVLSNGCTSTCAWNDADHVYGKMSNKFVLRPSAHLYHLLNTYFVGDVVTTVSSDKTRIVPFAVFDEKSGRKSILLVNRSGAPQSVNLTITGVLAPTGLSRHEISEAGYTELPFESKALNAPLTLPACSVTVIAAPIGS